ncbi:MAG: UDP-N-acetylglucosamine 1-carboxyvinyltransferase [Limnochordia bacterium]|nr:UDP-N-acetylglucosamine 1-carboxyvinyltransferase [Limnochordia bacterium]MDD2629766.1 UDP-N-acetylglucosamine 1-carboxyvinyltransferase [Limnochordia bacterium]MDD4519179.1 UDP-N-acetylglucosamine 1-carboxyvinyltransferase [Limnochordia bacterium]
MSKLSIVGLGPLRGEVCVGGAKNAALKMLVACLLTDDECIIHNVPRIKDVEVMLEVLRFLGCDADFCGAHSVRVRAEGDLGFKAPDVLVRKMRASIQVMGPLLARLGKVQVAYPGGCAIGERPIDIHLAGFAALGADIGEKEGYILAEAGKLVGCEFYLDFPSVGATENLIMAGVLAQGQTVLHNVAKEPEIVDLQDFLNKMGAKVMGAGTDRITIQGVERLSGTEHWVIPDRIEAGTFMLAGAITKGDVYVRHANVHHLEALQAKLLQSGVALSSTPDGIWVRAGRAMLQPLNLRTMPYPGFPTDLQPQMMAFLCTVAGTSMIIEGVYAHRMKHAAELRRMGASIWVEGRSAIIQGGNPLTGASVQASDLRAGAALILAGLAACGTTEVYGLEHIDRGYEHLESKFQELGACITRLP